MALTRRSFLARAALTVAAAAGAGGLVRLTAPAPPALSATRRRTYLALVDAVGRGTHSQVDPARAHEALASLAADYPRALAPARAAIDDTLDRLERAPAGRPFAELDPAARLSALRAAEPDLAARAVALAAVPFHPPASDFHPTPILL